MYSANRTITKNTVFLYTRMMFVMLVLLYTSRVILQKLGIDDYGIYQSVGGIVALFFSFFDIWVGKWGFWEIETYLFYHIIFAYLDSCNGGDNWRNTGNVVFAIQNGYTVGTVGCSYICVSYIYRDCGLFIDTDPL